MAGTRSSRWAFARCRTFFVWAMMPLAVANGEAVVGCGCTGQFESVCHCGMCTSATAGDLKHAACEPHPQVRSCCCHRASAEAQLLCQNGTRPNEPVQFQTHQCTTIVLQAGERVITDAPHVGDQLHFSMTLLATIDVPIASKVPAGAHVFAFDSGPPVLDFVITLRRLVI